MPRLRVEIELSARASRGLRRRDFARAVREQAVLQLVREARISQGRGAEILRISREDFFDLMARGGVPHVRMTAREVRAGLAAARDVPG
jgi:hypothetical protein